jgi:acyl-coenzyme A thioesterase PaaI-like protein
MFEENQDNLILLHNDLQTIQLPEGMNYQLPPNSFTMLNGRFIDYVSRQQLTTRFWIDKKFSNPQGTVQGGILAGCFDDTFGPLGVSSCRKPILTMNMNIQYIRSVPLENDFYIITKVVSISRTTIFMSAEAFNIKGKLLAQASTNQLILR